MPILDKEQVDLISSAYAEGCLHNNSQPDEADLKKILEWAEQTIIGSAILENVLSGNVAPVYKEGEVVFQITPAGKEKAEAIQWNNPQSDLVQ